MDVKINTIMKKIHDDLVNHLSKLNKKSSNTPDVHGLFILMNYNYIIVEKVLCHLATNKMI